MIGCENWTTKEDESQRTGAFELWGWRRLLRVPWTARRSNQSILKKIHPEYSLEGLMLKLKLQYFGHLPGDSDGKYSAWSVGDPHSIPGSGRSPGEGNDIPLQYSCLENPTDRGAW